ncbi:MAG: hypothetical protein AB7L66_02500 [Gemmatimonadales bacterium]
MARRSPLRVLIRPVVVAAVLAVIAALTIVAPVMDRVAPPSSQ